VFRLKTNKLLINVNPKFVAYFCVLILDANLNVYYLAAILLVR